MTLLTKQEAEQLLRRASGIAQVPATTKDNQAALSGNKGAIVLLVKP
jgi:hypothetical protein